MRDMLTPPRDDRDAATEALALEEYRALRATIRERGTLRLFVGVITFVAWGALLLTTTVFNLPPLYSLVPLLVLAGGLESVYAAHVGVERVGRYIQVRFETSASGPPDWEHTAMRLQGQPGTSTGTDPLFSRLFTVATLLNLLPLVLSRSPVSVALSLGVGACHLLFLLRLALSRRFAAGQNRRDVELVRGTPAGPPEP